MKEARLWVQPEADGGAEVWLEADSPSGIAAAAASDAFRAEVARENRSLGPLVTRGLTGGLLDHVEVTTVARTTKAHVHATEGQVNLLVELLAAWLGAGSGASASAP